MHSPQPWTDKGGLKTIGWGIRDNLVIRDANEMPVCACYNEEAMRRILACVKACRGISTDVLELENGEYPAEQTIHVKAENIEISSIGKHFADIKINERPIENVTHLMLAKAFADQSPWELRLTIVGCPPKKERPCSDEQF